MKYRLKKDLPFAKAGEPITFRGSDLTGKYITYEVDPINGLRIWVTDEGFSKLKREGWIEEVKPREFEIHLGKFGDFLSFLDSSGYCYNSNRAYDCRKPEIIKVREVLE